MADSANMRKPIKDSTPSFGKAGVSSTKPAASSGTSGGRPKKDSEVLGTKVKNQAPSFASGLDNGTANRKGAAGAAPAQKDSDKMRAPIKNQTPSFGRADIK